MAKPKATNARPVPATGAPVIRSDVPQAGTELTKPQEARKSGASTAAGRWLIGSDFSPTSACGQPCQSLCTPRVHTGRTLPPVNTPGMRLLWWGPTRPFACACLLLRTPPVAAWYASTFKNQYIPSFCS